MTYAEETDKIKAEIASRCSSKVATYRNGRLYYRGFWRSRNGMERQAEQLERGRYPEPELAADCRAAIAEYDADQPTVTIDAD